ncbi:MAG TPA: tetratricopeptide repeat protein [Phycisphaerales bacterium]|nr:tetratricopeptide repeat protein [Phycisphaerales bacterium]
MPQPSPQPEQNPHPRQTWRDVWQVPVLGASVLLLAGGLAAAFVTRPKPDLNAGMQGAKQQIEARAYEDALRILNDDVLPGISKGTLTPDQRREFHLLRARALYLGQKELNLDRAENHRAIVSEYMEAEHLNAALTEHDQQYLCTSLLALGEVERAVRRVQNLPDSSREARTALIKRCIDAATTARPPNPTLALDLITFLTGDAQLSLEDRAWALARQGRVLLAQGYASEAVGKIVKSLPRLDGASPAMLGEIHYTLARAFEKQNELEESAQELDKAAALLESGSPLIPSLTLLQGQIYHRKPGLGSARDRYQAIINKFAHSPELVGALLGMGEVEAETLFAQDNGQDRGEGGDAAGALTRSLDYYTRVVELVRTSPSSPDGAAVTPDRIGESLLARCREQVEARKPDYRRALQFADLGEQLFGVDKAPPELLLVLAQVHQELAEEILASATAKGGVLSLADADPATQREAREHLVRAGEYYRNHAARVVAANVGLYGESLWAAADVFDRAGDTDAAISAFQQFAADFPTDVRQPEASFRLAQCYQARGDLELAAKIYRTLIAGRDKGEQAGPFADASYVPLAQTLLTDADHANDADAENLLVSVVNGALGGTRAPAFRDALRELGQRYYVSGRHERAIERFEEFLTRTAQDGTATPPGAVESVRYKLADSYRLSAAGLAAQLASGAMPDGERRGKEEARESRLRAASAAFEQVRTALEARSHRTALEDLYLRNSYYYLGACAFDLKDYTGAIAHYDAARERYPKDPASLVALVQVVSCYLAQGDVAKAALANQRAQRFYDSIPASAWEDPNLPMTRADWKQWLDAKDELRRAGEGATAGVKDE